MTNAAEVGTTARAEVPRPGHGGQPATLVKLAAPREKKAFVRAPPDRSQRWRLGFQLAFLLL
ncbi:MAG TPA: hypothetical protein VLS93_17370, partial [Anaeromyxobacteraceae bacterium]|nr:hypothetical protein [Anaeromyxobacteraceae bacterium]